MRAIHDQTEQNGHPSFVISGIYLVLVGVIGGITNIIALLKAYQAQRTKLNLILINLIVSDLFIIFIGIPIDAVGAFTMGKALDETVCSFVAFTHTLFGMSSLYTLTTVAAIRCRSVLLHERSWYLVSRVTFYSSRCVHLIWGSALLIALPPIIGIGEYVVDIGMISCAPNWSSIDKFSLFYNWYLMTLGFFIPTTIVIVSNILVFYKSRKRTKKAIIRKKESILERGPKKEHQPVSDGIRKEEKMQRKLTLLSTLMTMAFYLSWMPYALVCLLVMSDVMIPKRYQMFASLFAKSGTLINPILYIFFNKDINTQNNSSFVSRPKLIDQDTRTLSDQKFEKDSFPMYLLKKKKTAIEICSSDDNFGLQSKKEDSDPDLSNDRIDRKMSLRQSL